MSSFDRFEHRHNVLISTCESDGFINATPEGKIRTLLLLTSQELNAFRSSAWGFNPDKTQLICHEFYNAKDRLFDSGMELSKADFPAYFKAISLNRVVVADNARQHPATAEFTASYLMPLGIYSMVDAPIYSSRKQHGVLCIEDGQQDRQWTVSDVSLILAVADKISLVLEHQAWIKASETVLQVKRCDTLTGLENRVSFQARIEECVACTVKASCGSQRAVLAIGLDAFTDINDTWGHALANEVLVTIANRLSGYSKKGQCHSARIGGDVFGIWLPRICDDDQVLTVIDGLRDALGRPVRLSNGVTLEISACIGVANVKAASQHAYDPIRYAEIALQRAKDRGVGEVEFFNTNWLSDYRKKRQSEEELLVALEQYQLVPFYQPIIDSQTGLTAGVEALVRWQHPLRGVLSPIDFLPLATKMGLMTQLGEQVLSCVCRDISRFKQLRDLRWISVNLASEQLYSGSLVDKVTCLLKKHGVAGNLLELEIVEDLISIDVGTVTNQLNALADLGIKLAIDDFGTGYSSLARLKHLPVSKLKIDKSFVDGLPSDESDRCIANSIMGMARGLHLDTVAEGVETPEQAAWLIEHSCTYLQGYLFAKPMPVENLILFLEASTQA